jgi:hypothetical protein
MVDAIMVASMLRMLDISVSSVGLAGSMCCGAIWGWTWWYAWC